MQARNLTNDILGTLETSAHSASSIQDMLAQQYGGRDWWPYVICPVVFLMVGSYGLPPSVARNMVLLGLGGATALAFSLYIHLSNTGFVGLL